METRYDSVIVDARGLELISQIKDKAEHLARIIDMTPCRESSIALTNLESAIYFAVRAVAKANQAVTKA